MILHEPKLTLPYFMIISISNLIKFTLYVAVHHHHQMIKRIQKSATCLLILLCMAPYQQK